MQKLKATTSATAPHATPRTVDLLCAVLKAASHAAVGKRASEDQAFILGKLDTEHQLRHAAAGVSVLATATAAVVAGVGSGVAGDVAAAAAASGPDNQPDVTMDDATEGSGDVEAPPTLQLSLSQRLQLLTSLFHRGSSLVLELPHVQALWQLSDGDANSRREVMLWLADATGWRGERAPRGGTPLRSLDAFTPPLLRYAVTAPAHTAVCLFRASSRQLSCYVLHDTPAGRCLSTLCAPLRR